MLKKITDKYLIYGLLVMFILVMDLDFDYLSIFIINILSFLSFGFILYRELNQKQFRYTSGRLGVLVFSYSFILVGLYKLLSYVYTGNLFVFSESDASVYHFESIEMASHPFVEGIDVFLKKWSTEDLGAVLIISTLYRIIESQLFLNLFYIITGVITSLSIFSIGKNIMSNKYAFLAALSYGISSFVIWFHASGLKESFMIMLVVLFFDKYYKFLKAKVLKHLIFGLIFLSGLMLFRPAILFFCIAAVIIGTLLSKKLTAKTFFALLVLSGVVIFSFTYIALTADRFLMGGMDELLSIKEADGKVQGSIGFTYLVNILASTIGPLPTILPNTKIILSFFSSGLIFKTFISIAFWLGVYYAYKRRVGLLYPLIIFVILEELSLITILEALELRKSLPHMAIVYIVSFWLLDKFESKYFFSKIQKIRMIRLSSVLMAGISILILFWNFRYN